MTPGLMIIATNSPNCFTELDLNINKLISVT